MHRRLMSGAVGVSGAFLVSYIAHHLTHGTTRFGGRGAIRTAYLAILVSHTVLAALLPPLVFLVLLRALRRRFEAHRRLARVTLPIWLYVSVTGVLVYVFLYHLDPARGG